MGFKFKFLFLFEPRGLKYNFETKIRIILVKIVRPTCFKNLYDLQLFLIINLGAFCCTAGGSYSLLEKFCENHKPEGTQFMHKMKNSLFIMATMTATKTTTELAKHRANANHDFFRYTFEKFNSEI